MPIPSDLEIASDAKLLPLTDIAASAGIAEEFLEFYGSGAAKIKLEAIEALKDRPDAKYVVVSAITPPPRRCPRPLPRRSARAGRPRPAQTRRRHRAP